MKLVMNMVRKPFKQGDVIFETSERSDELYLIHTGSVEIRSRLADANRMNEERWQQLNIYRSLTPEEIERP